MAQTSGPIFHPDAEVAILMEGIGRSIADKLMHRWLVNLDSSIRVNRHVYTSEVVVQRDGGGEWRVTDGGVVYGPWLRPSKAQVPGTHLSPGFPVISPSLGLLLI